MTHLPNLTLVLVDTVNYGKSVCSLNESRKHIAPAKTIFFTDVGMRIHGVDVVNIPPIQSKAEYSRFIIKELYKHIETDFVLVTQHDGFCLTDKFDPDFFDYDYIGAKWLYTDGRNVGNGGFSLRSKRLMEIVATDPIIDVYDPEDAVICRLYRRYLEEKHGIKFAPEDVADRFSFELNEPTNDTLGFHSYFWPPHTDTVMITREGAMGDVIMTEPILHHFHKKGYRVVLNTLPQFENLFIQHYFPVLFKNQLNPKLKYREISLDMAYEISPKTNHLEAYYDVCGVPESERIMRNPVLTLDFDPKLRENKLFPKYAVLHIDRRPQGGRNIYGVNWSDVARYLSAQGYTVLHIGKGESEHVYGAARMNTPTEPFMKWVVGGADLFVGIDSGPANMAVAMGVPAAIFTGSVDLRTIYPDLSRILWLNNNDKEVCSKPMCWHSVVGTQGVQCIVDESRPPCAVFETELVLRKIENFISHVSHRH